jgi:hypothetical protein
MQCIFGNRDINPLLLRRCHARQAAYPLESHDAGAA